MPQNAASLFTYSADFFYFYFLFFAILQKNKTKQKKKKKKKKKKLKSPKFKMNLSKGILRTFANDADPDKRPQNADSDQGQHCLLYVQDFW